MEEKNNIKKNLTAGFLRSKTKFAEDTNIPFERCEKNLKFHTDKSKSLRNGIKKVSGKTHSTEDTLRAGNPLIFAKSNEDLSSIVESSFADSSFDSQTEEQESFSIESQVDSLCETTYLANCLSELKSISLNADWSLNGTEKVKGNKEKTLVLGFEGVVCLLQKSTVEEGFQVEFRPGLKYFLGTLAEHFNIVFYSLLEDKLLEQIFASCGFLSKFKRFGRSKACPVKLSSGEDFFIKRIDLFSDLSAQNTLFAETNLILCGDYLENAIPLREFKGGEDGQLLVLLDYLKSVLEAEGTLAENNENMLGIRQFYKSL